MIFRNSLLLQTLAALLLFSAPVLVHSFHIFDHRRPGMRTSAWQTEFCEVDSHKYLMMTIPRLQRNYSYEYHSSALRYKNHREVQVDLDLQFSLDDLDMTTTTTTREPFRILMELLRRFWYRLHVRFRQLKKAFRAVTQKYTIYVLACENGKYYVGSTSNKRQRFRQHMEQGGGAAWTRLYKPRRVTFQYRRVRAPYYLGMEAKVTAEWMLKHGINNVRGAMYCETRDYTLVGVLI